MSKISGVVEEVKIYNPPDKNWVKTSVAVGGNWYGGFQSDKKDPDPLKVVKGGDKVTIDYEQNGKYFNIKDLVIDAPATKPAVMAADGSSVSFDKDFNMTKGNAAKLAVGFVLGAVAPGIEALPLGAKNKKAATLMNHIKHYTEEFTSMLISITPESLEKKDAKPVEEDAEEEPEYHE